MYKSIRRFLVKIIIILLPLYVLFPYPMWKYFHGECYGDMHEQGTPFFDEQYKDLYYYFPTDMPSIHITDDYISDAENLNKDSIVLVIGDSFSQQGSRSFMVYMQREMPGYHVMNVRTMLDGGGWKYIHHSLMAEDDVKLVFPEMLDFLTYMLLYAKNLPKFIIVESAEFMLASRLLNTNYAISDSVLAQYKESSAMRVAATQRNEAASVHKKDLPSAFTNAQIWIKHLFGVANHTRHQKLDGDYFSCKDKERDLYFYTRSLEYFSEEKVAEAMKVKDSLVELAEKKGVTLLFLVCPDKLDLYRSHIVNISPKYQVQSFFDALEKVGNSNNIINGKTLLMPYVDKGEKDLYYCNDTHWSHRSAEIVSKEISKILQL